MSYTVHYDDNHLDHNIDGFKCPSITQVLTELKTKYYRQGSAQAGSDRHEICNMLDRGEIKIDDVPAAFKGYAEGWLKFKSDVKAEILHTELPVGSKRLMVVGRLDYVLKITDEIMITDIKTGGKEKWHELQLTGYGFCFDEMFPTKPHKSLAALYLKSNGTYKLEEEKYWPAAFVGGVNMWRWMTA